ncbi:molecular chaperone DnaJ [Synechococcus sp. PCC 7336]|uniref:molecular chaperone DnaJ n=1 Tax=Synechococcus sp. PCC 7336 TaxID=195250 RepID=UPI000349E259|nr:molecular chaperone DnaJ [Synechococcus sp. PCC 7336]
MARDYYELLGVSRDSSKEDIKRAYRRLARKYHPDVNKEPEAEELFKEINRAYEVLSDPQVKARYDQFGEAGVGGAAAGAGFQDLGDMGGFADIFESFFTNFGGAAAGGRRRSGPVRGDDLRFDLKLNFLDAVFGGEKQIRISHLEVCDVCRGSGAREGSGPTNCPTCGGAGQVRRATRTPFGSFTQLTICPTCNGAGEVIEDFCDNCGGEGQVQTNKKLRITVPPGVDSGTRLRVSGEGDAGRRSGPSGDLYVYLFIEPDREFQRDGIDILSEVSVSYLQAILGAHILVNTVDGEEELTVPTGSQPGTVLRLEGKGVPKLGNPVARGDHLITLVVEIPTRTSAEERELLHQLAELRGESTDKGGGRFLGGLFR